MKLGGPSGGIAFYHRLGDLVPYIFHSGEVFFRLYFFHPHISPPLRGGMILIYTLVGAGATSRFIRLG